MSTILVIAFGILACVAFFAILTALWRALSDLFTDILKTGGKMVWGVIGLVILFWCLYKFF